MFVYNICFKQMIIINISIFENLAIQARKSGKYNHFRNSGKRSLGEETFQREVMMGSLDARLVYNVLAEGPGVACKKKEMLKKNSDQSFEPYGNIYVY